MRNVWVLTSLLHAALYLRARRNWSVVKGTPGIPEYSSAFASSLTIFVQFRSVKFRDSKVISISEVVPSTHMASIRASTYDNTLGFWGRMTLGNTLYARCLLGW